MKTLPKTKIALLIVLGMLITSCSLKDIFFGRRSLDNPKSSLSILHEEAEPILPEGTLDAYVKAIELGANVIQPDLVLTRDAYLIVHHEPMLSTTTNVAMLPEFAGLKTTKVIDGKLVTDWFASDFTLAEIKTLKVKQVVRGNSETFGSEFSIPTFEEVIQFVKQKSNVSGKHIAVYPELRHPYFHNEEIIGVQMEDILLSVLKEAGWDQKEAPIAVQCLEVAPLQYIRKRSSVTLVQLISYYDTAKDGSLIFDVPEGDFISYGAPLDFYKKGDQRTYEFFTTKEGIAFVATYADSIGGYNPATLVDEAYSIVAANQYHDRSK